MRGDTDRAPRFDKNSASQGHGLTVEGAKEQLSTFSLLQANVRRLLENEDITEPSTIQTLAIPRILQGSNVLIIAPTGTGKTYAAMMPIFELFLQTRDREPLKGISILYVTPLRALNRDILRKLAENGKQLDIKVQVRHGDTSTYIRSLQAKFPPDMMITTPETLQAILPGKKMRQHLSNVRWVVIDEIHELAADKRGVQLSVALERLCRLAGREFQRIGLSATIGEDHKVGHFLVGQGRTVEIVKSEEGRKFEAEVEYVTPTEEDYKASNRLGIPAPSAARIRRIGDLISKHTSTLVFTNTREHAEALGSQIHAINEALPVKVHHGSLSREIREEVEKEFQSGAIKAVICTSSLELGIDIGLVDFIIQYMSPREATRLIQRIGRSGHEIKGIPRGVIISGWADDILESSVIISYARQEKLEKVKIHENALDVLAHQIVGILLDRGRCDTGQILETVTRAYPYATIDPEDFLATLKQLADLRIITQRENIVQARFPKAFHYYYENLSMIPDVKRFTVFDFIRKRRIGTLDQEFVARSCKPRVEFIMHGNTWRVVATDEEKLSVEVEPVAPSLGAIPSWEGEIIPVDYSVSNEVGAIRKSIVENVRPASNLVEIATKLSMNSEAMEKVEATLRSHVNEYVLPTENRIVVEKFENCIVVHACFGNLVNATLATAMASLLSARYGFNVATQTDPYRIGLIVPLKINAILVANELKKLKPEDLDKIVLGSMEESELFAWRHWHVARRFGAVERKAEYRTNHSKFLVSAFKNSPINKETRREILQEKFDLEQSKLVMQKICQGEISIEIIEQEKPSCSPLAMPIVDKVIPHDLLRPAVPAKALAEIVKERLLSETMRLVCFHKADWEGLRTVRTLPETIRCPTCKSTLIAATYPRDESLIKIAKKKLQRKPLPPEEEREWHRGWTSASLVQTSGRKAIIAMSGRGVGPTTAIRILRRFHRTEEEFYTEILKAERNYARTRMFWD